MLGVYIYIYIISLLTITYHMVSIISILQVRKLKLKKVKRLPKITELVHGWPEIRIQAQWTKFKSKWA